MKPQEELIEKIKKDMGAAYDELVYFCPKCNKTIEITSNPERLYFCSCGKSGDYVNCETMKLGEYLYGVMKLISEQHNGEISI